MSLISLLTIATHKHQTIKSPHSDVKSEKDKQSKILLFKKDIEKISMLYYRPQLSSNWCNKSLEAVN